MNIKKYLKTMTFLSAITAGFMAYGQVVTTVAGRNLSGYKDAQDTSARFNRPHDIAVDAQGNIFVADQLNHRIRMITPSGLASTFAGSGTTGSADGTGVGASFNNPTGLVFDSKGNLFVSDYTNHKIRKITPAGVVSTFAGSGQAGGFNATGTIASFNGPVGMCVDDNDNIYLAEQGGHIIRKITSGAVVTTIAGKYGNGGYGDGNGTTAMFNGPYDVCRDTKGNLFVADQNNHVIRKINATGYVSLFAGKPQTAGTANGDIITARLSLPLSLVYDQFSELIYFVDYGNNRVRYVDTAGSVYAFVGSLQTYADGTGSNAAFKHPTGICFDNNRNFIVADYENHCIRKITNPTASVFSLYKSQALATIFPNPTSRNVTISSSKNIGLVQVFDMTGKEITNQKAHIIDMGDFAAGTYVVRITYSDYTFETTQLQVAR